MTSDLRARIKAYADTVIAEGGTPPEVRAAVREKYGIGIGGGGGGNSDAPSCPYCGAYGGGGHGGFCPNGSLRHAGLAQRRALNPLLT